MNPREVVKLDLLEDHTRRVSVNGRIYVCEGQKFRPHECAGGIELNEVIYTRNHIRHLKESEKRYFWSFINCALMCSVSHTRFGHARDFRNWWITSRAQKLYGWLEVANYIKDAPNEIKALYIAEAQT